MPVFVALLRAVNVGKRMVPMAGLRSLCADLGFTDVRTHLASGNVVFGAQGSAATLERQLETAIADELGIHSDVVVRTPRQWSTLERANPFPKESEAEPSRVLVVVSKRRPKASAAATVEDRGRAGERASVAGGALWIHYAGGIGRSKVTPEIVDRAVGSPATGRNWSTVLALGEVLGAASR